MSSDKVVLQEIYCPLIAFQWQFVFVVHQSFLERMNVTQNEIIKSLVLKQ